ncbi:hypothetical protein ACFYPN_11210 [Streptomyces sp. NPDC005576]|uniref:hypothetical protein n=1 Tax=unclassified Streptomyces TaxID=2593676 RepID=UPI003409560B
MVRQQMKLAAVLAVVVLALTGFSTSSHGHGSSHSSGDGGGCSNDRKSNGGYGSTTNNYDDDDDYDYGSGSDSSSVTDEPTLDAASVPTPDPEVRVIKCAQPAEGSRKAVTSSQVELTPVTFGTAEVDITVTFSDSATNTLDTAHLRVELDSTDSLDPQKFTVPMAHPGKVDDVHHCDARAVFVG